MLYYALVALVIVIVAVLLGLTVHPLFWFVVVFAGLVLLSGARGRSRL